MPHNIIQSPIGDIMITELNGAIHSIRFCDEATPATSKDEMTPLLTRAAKQLNDYFSNGKATFELPCEQAGSAFQQRVWQELMHIPFGKTISYQTLANRLGDPKCIRAAAAANGKNDLAIVVPCHRVIGSNGSLTGYAGGLWRKQWLLEHEAKHAQGLQLLF